MRIDVTTQKDLQVSIDFHIVLQFHFKSHVLRFPFLIQVAFIFTLIFKLMSSDLTCCFRGSREAHLVSSLSMFISVLEIVYYLL